jgi:hypothetical protein
MVNTWKGSEGDFEEPTHWSEGQVPSGLVSITAGVAHISDATPHGYFVEVTVGTTPRGSEVLESKPQRPYDSADGSSANWFMRWCRNFITGRAVAG